MLKHNIVLILRNLWRKKIYTSVILLSLIVAFVCSNILIPFLTYETSTDSFHQKKDSIFQVFSSDPFLEDGRISYMPNYLPDYLTRNYAEIKEVAQLSGLENVHVKIGMDVFQDFTLLVADSSLFSIFDFPVVHGYKEEYLAPGTIVLSAEKAELLFGKSAAVGRIIEVITPDTVQVLTVSAVSRKSKVNSHLIFDAIVHHTAFPNTWNGGANYVLMANPEGSKALESKINTDVNRPGLIGPGRVDYFFGTLEGSYFRPENKMGFMKTRNPAFVQLGYIACGLVLFIAGFNFINLFLLFWQERKKEIGIKKTLGITKKGLLGFSITEAAFYVLLAYGISVLMTILILPVFNSVFESNLSIAYFLTTEVVAYIGFFLFFCGAIIVVFSVSKQFAVSPVNLISKKPSKLTFNTTLFTMQFIISIALAICSITIIQQMNYVENASLGFNRSIVQLDAPNRKSAQKLRSIKENLLGYSQITNVTVSGGNPISGNISVRYDLEDNQFYTPFLFGGDTDFIKTLGLTLLEGNLPSEIREGKLVNEKMVRQFGIVHPIGKNVPGTKDVIIGVVKDFTCGSFKEEVPPVIISHYDTGQALLIAYQGAGLSALIPTLQKEWNGIFHNNYFTYTVLEQELIAKYREDAFLYQIIVTFAIISIVLSCFGLFALSWAVTQSRAKEIGIRKVLGGSSLDIMNLLTLTFTRHILIAFLIAVPIGYFSMKQWLMGFANRIEIDFWIFAIAALLVMTIAFMTLSVQTAKAMLKNPVDEIRAE